MTWTDISEELPEVGQKVVIVIPVNPEINTDMRYLKDVPYLDYDGDWRRLFSEENEVIHPSHWMALPDDPDMMNIKGRLQ